MHKYINHYDKKAYAWHKLILGCQKMLCSNHSAQLLIKQLQHSCFNMIWCKNLYGCARKTLL